MKNSQGTIKRNEVGTTVCGGLINVGFIAPDKSHKVVQPKKYPLGIHTDEHGRKFVQTLEGKIY